VYIFFFLSRSEKIFDYFFSPLSACIVIINQHALATSFFLCMHVDEIDDLSASDTEDAPLTLS